MAKACGPVTRRREGLILSAGAANGAAATSSNRAASQITGRGDVVTSNTERLCPVICIAARQMYHRKVECRNDPLSSRPSSKNTGRGSIGRSSNPLARTQGVDAYLQLTVTRRSRRRRERIE